MSRLGLIADWELAVAAYQGDIALRVAYEAAMAFGRWQYAYA